MSKGLEALKELIIKLKSLGYTRCDEWLGFIIIEKELREYESYRGFLDNVEKGIVTYTPRDTWEEERKKLKVLDIIKRHPFILERLFDESGMHDDYDHDYWWGVVTDKEVEMVKEWLL